MIAIAAALALVVTISSVAFGYFSTAGSGTGSATTGTLNAPTGVSGTQTPGSGSVVVTWTASTGTPAPDGYYVLRVPTVGSPVAACGSPSSLVSGTSCTDTAVPLGAYSYTVIAVHLTWTAQSAASATVNVVKAGQTVTITSSPVAPTFGDTYGLTATGGGSGNPVTFGSSTPGTCTVTGSTATFVHAGPCTITADQAGSTYYDAAPQATQSFTVAKAAQTITFTSTAPTNATVDGSGYQPTATSTGSVDPVTFTIAASTALNCSINAGVVSYLKAGTCTIDANKAGDADHLDAAQVQQSFEIAQAAQAINFTSIAPSDAKVNDTYTVTATGGASGNAVTFSIDPSSAGICSIAGALVSFNAAGTCRVNANQAGNTDYLAAAQVQQAIVVTKKTQSIIFGTTPVSPTFNGPTYTVGATATSGLTVIFSTATPSVCAVTGTTVTFLGAGTCTIHADQAGNGVWAAAPQATQTFAVAKATQTITFNPALTANAPSSATLTATSSAGLTPVTFSTSTPAVCTVSGSTVTYVAGGSCALTAAQAGDTDYDPGTASATVAVTAIDTTPPVISNVQPASGASGAWNSIDCSVAGVSANRVCASVTDNVGVVLVTYKLQKNSNPGNGNCWTGSSFSGGSACTSPPSMTLSSGSVYVSSVLTPGSGAGSFTGGGYTLTIVATDAAGNSTTSTTTFTRT